MRTGTLRESYTDTLFDCSGIVAPLIPMGRVGKPEESAEAVLFLGPHLRRGERQERAD